MNPTFIVTSEYRLKLILNIANQIYIIKLRSIKLYCAAGKIEHIPLG